MRMSYTELKSALDATWSDKSNRMRVLAARYYVGAETVESLRNLTIEHPCHKHATTSPALTEKEANYIIMMR